MTENVENLVLEHLRAIRATLADHGERLDRIESRIGSLELTVAGMRRDMAHMYGDTVELRVDYDRLASRVERIERRLDLSAAPT